MIKEKYCGDCQHIQGRPGSRFCVANEINMFINSERACGCSNFLKKTMVTDIRSKIIGVVAKIDNGTHSSDFLQSIDEELFELFKKEMLKQNAGYVEKAE